MAWADFTKKISQTTQDASDKMKKMAEISRLNSEINSAEDRIRQICNEVGAYVVNNNLYTEDKMIADAHERIRAIREQTAANQAKVYELKGMVPCKKCGNMVAPPAVSAISAAPRWKCPSRLRPRPRPALFA
ncbi:MAG: hypothetical protein ACLUUJ_05500 [Acutalibacteraceae bacterium]